MTPVENWRTDMHPTFKLERERNFLKPCRKPRPGCTVMKEKITLNLLMSRVSTPSRSSGIPLLSDTVKPTIASAPSRLYVRHSTPT